MKENQRISDLKKFYSILEKLRISSLDKSTLAICTGRDKWPERGVYFFFESGEIRSESGTGLRVVRVGTHALKTGGKSTLWKRLYQHKGFLKNGSGNHRGSIFRLLVGMAIINRKSLSCPTWGQGNSAQKDILENEVFLEKLVSEVIGQMPFLVLPINDEPGPESLRGYIERNSIALLSNYNKESVDSSTEGWLGYACNRERVRSSGLWNQNHVDEEYDRDFLGVLEELVRNRKG